MKSRRLVYQQGDHICTLYNSPEEQLEAAVDFIQAGLGRVERCLYICGEHTPQHMRNALKRGGVDVEGEEKRGALMLITKNEAHLKGGYFSADKMIGMLQQAVKDALHAGFNGLCAAGDMAWIMDNASGTEQFAEYERRLNTFYAENRALGLCQYSRTTLPHAFLDHCIATHKFIRIDASGLLLENPFYEEPAHAMGRQAAGDAEVGEKIARIFGAHI